MHIRGKEVARIDTNPRSEAFMEHAMATWGALVYRIALNQASSPHDADDIAQDVFISLLQDGTAFSNDEHLKAWLICVTVNRCRAQRRLGRREPPARSYAPHRASALHRGLPP